MSPEMERRVRVFPEPEGPNRTTRLSRVVKVAEK